MKTSTPRLKLPVIVALSMIIARVRPQLRHALVQVADLHPLGLRETKRKQHRANGNQQRPPPLGPDKSADRVPNFTRPHLAPGHALSRYPARGFWYDNSSGNSSKFVRMIAATPMLAAMASSRIVGTGMSRIVTKPIVSVISATPARHEQLPECCCAPTSSEIAARKQLGAKRPHHLHTMAHANRKNEERHEDRHRVDAVAKEVQQAKLPRHRRD